LNPGKELSWKTYEFNSLIQFTGFSTYNVKNLRAFEPCFGLGNQFENALVYFHVFFLTLLYTSRLSGSMIFRVDSRIIDKLDIFWFRFRKHYANSCLLWIFLMGLLFLSICIILSYYNYVFRSEMMCVSDSPELNFVC